MFARILALLLTTFYLLLATPVYAQNASNPSTSKESKPTFEVSQVNSSPVPYTLYPIPSYVSPTSPLYTDLFVHNMFHSFSCLAIGQSVIGQPCLTYQITKNAQGMVQSVPMLAQTNLSGGTLGAVTGVIGALYQNPPVRTADYLASVGQGLGIVKEANAQVVGSGAQVLSPILQLWQVSRNISYVLMIIIFLVIGLMVMFRNKLNPQTVITAQAALPGLIIGLIMITFSYFFAGLISDMAFVGTNVVGYYFSAVRGQTNPPQNLVNDISKQNILSLFAPLTKVVDSPKIADALGSIWNDLASPTTNRWNPLDLDPQKVISNLALFMMTQLVLPFGNMIGGPGQVLTVGPALVLTGLFPVQVVALALSFIAMVVLIWAMFQLLLRLINAYLTIIVLTITAPFQLLGAALPGRQGMATGWILSMLANVLVFPAVLAVLYFVAFILSSMGTGSPQNNLNPYCTQPCPFKVSSMNSTDNNFTVRAEDPNVDPIKITNSNGFPLFGGLNLNFLNLLLAFGALTALPAIPGLVTRSIGKLGQAGQLIGQEIGGNIGQGQKYAGQFQQGVGGFANQIGRLTNTTSTQTLFDPSTGSFRPIPTMTEGQLARLSRGWSGFRSGVRRRIGI